MVEIVPGTILIADPFLKDPNFIRSVIFLCEHQNEGSFGFVINRPYQQTVGDVIPDLAGCDIPLFYGGPVQQNTLHYLHTCPKTIGGIEVRDGIFWGGEFETVQELLRNGELNEKQIRFYIGYSGWTEGQLEAEIETKSWIMKDASRKLVFHNEADLIWPDALKDLGGEYVQMVNYPIDPQLN
jgi:putative transcriptional regulator